MAREAAARPACLPRYATPRNFARQTLGPQATAIALELGQPLMPWQQMVLDVALEYEDDPDYPMGRRFVYREVIFGTPRQSGKSYLLLIKFLHRLILCGHGQACIYSMQTGSDAARKLMDDWLPMIQDSPFDAAISHIRRSMGARLIRFKTASTLELLSSGKAAGHGRTIDEAALDEVMADVDDRREQAVIPAMLTRPNAQLVITSTAGTEESLYWRRKVDLGRELAEAGDMSEVCYFEWSAPDECDPYDEAVWWSCMPALGISQSVANVKHAAKSMQEFEFRRAMLNQWTAHDDKIIDWAAWVECRSTHGAIANEMVLAFDVNKERTATSICAASLGSDGIIDVELVQRDEGITWVVPRLVELLHRHMPIAIIADGNGPGAALIPELERQGVVCKTLTTNELPKACGAFYDHILARRLRVRPNDHLDAAVASASKRIRGDSFVWQRSTATGDISALYTATLATWGVAGDPNHGALWLY